MDKHSIAVVCIAEAGKLTDASLELIGKARELSDLGGKRLTALIAGSVTEPLHAIYAGADEAAVLSLDPGIFRDDGALGSVIAGVLALELPDIALFSADIRGRCIAPWAASRLSTGLTADCTGLTLNEEGLLVQTRPAYGGNLVAQILCRDARPQMASVRAKIFPLLPMDENRRGTVRRISAPAILARVRRVSFVPSQEGISLQDAEVIVAGGKGVGSRKGFEKLERLAGLLKGAVGATRSAVDAGYAPYSRQIGQTGVIVRPKLYLAFGISGVVQHIVGMTGAGYVVAVNTDRQAPIFSYADYGIVAEWEPVCDRMTEILIKKEKAI